MTDRILNDMQNSYRYNHEETNDESLNEGNNVALTKRNYGSSDWLKRPDGRLLLAPRSVNWSSLRGEICSFHIFGELARYILVLYTL